MRRLWLCFWIGACADPSSGPTFGHVPDPDPSHLTVCNMGEPESLDPALSTSASDLKVVYELFDGLTTFDASAQPVPSLATSWEIAPDQRTFTFHLRDDARWSNGRPLVAGDFVYSIARTLHPLTASMNADVLHKLRHGKAYNAGTARVVLRDAPPFRAGDAVAALDGAERAQSPNLRVARGPTPLRAAASDAAAIWATATPGVGLTIIDVAGDWAYLYLDAGDGVFGWAPLAAFDAPNDDRPYHVRSLDGPTEGTVRGRDLLMLPAVLGVRAADAHTLVLETDGPIPYLLDLTLQRAFRPVPREAVSRWPRSWTTPEHIVTSGPFQLAARRTRDKIELVRSPAFWGAAGVRLERVTFLTLEDAAASAGVYYQGGCEVLGANMLPSSYFRVVQGKRDVAVVPSLGVYFVMINARRFPDVHFRRALAMALDRRVLGGVLRGGQLPTEQLVPGTPIARLSPAERTLCGVTADTPGVALIVEKGRLCYVPPFAPRFDPEAARRELELARADLGDRMPARLTFRYNAGFDLHRTVAEWVQAEWKRVLGLDVVLESQDWRTYLKSTASGDYDVARMTWLGNFADPESEFVNVFRCDNPDNRPHFCDPEVDRLLLEAEHEPDRARRLALIREVEARAVDAAAVIPLFMPTMTVLAKPYVRDYWVNLTDHQSLRAVWIDPDWRAR